MNIFVSYVPQSSVSVPSRVSGKLHHSGFKFQNVFTFHIMCKTPSTTVFRESVKCCPGIAFRFF
jgi:hypothetical protein